MFGEPGLHDIRAADPMQVAAASALTFGGAGALPLPGAMPAAEGCCLRWC